ncbi:MAG TPA: response regulator transcription factor, partial [Actinomycetota bacterium]
MAMIRVAIIDDHPVARWGVEHLFQAHPEIEVVCAAPSVAEVEAAGVAPDVVILDLYLEPGRPSLSAIAALAPRCRVLVMSASRTRGDILDAIRAGADGYLTKQASDDAFIEGVRQVAAGGFYLSSQLADMLQADLDQDQAPGHNGSRPDWGQLAPREQETLSCIAAGFTRGQTARRMGVSQSTVDTYVKRIRQKLGLGNKADLTRMAMELGHRDPPA